MVYNSIFQKENSAPFANSVFLDFLKKKEQELANEFRILLLNAPNLDYIILFLDEVDLHNLYRLMKRYGKIDELEKAARNAFQFVLSSNKEGDQKARRDKLLENQKQYDTPKKLVKLIPKLNEAKPGEPYQRHCSHIKRLQELVFGPTKPFRFNQFFGRSLLCNYEPGRLYDYTWKPLPSRTQCLATTTDNIMSTGLHFIEFQLQNMGTNKYLVYHVGVMRPRTEEQWSSTRQAQINHFSIFCRSVMMQLNRDRSRNWKGHIDCCAIRPRRLEMYPMGVSANTWQASWSPGLRANNDYTFFTALSSKNEYISTTKEGVERCGLLLDLKKGTLAYYRNGIHQGIVGKGLKGEYVWMIAFCGRPDRLRADVRFKCYTY